MTQRQLDRVSVHETGHLIDELSGQIPTTGLSTELRGIYNSLNNGQRNVAGRASREHRERAIRPGRGL
jgi:hypothetical protein